MADSGDNNDSSNNWCTIESDPGVFTELLEAVGVKGVELEELWMLDDETLSQLDPFYGLIFLFKWTPELHQQQQQQQETTRRTLSLDETPEGLFFARQTVTNACATQALLSVVLNTPSLDLGSDLTELRSFASSFTPELRGEAIGSSEALQTAHNAFSRKDVAFLQDQKPTLTATGKEDVFHFVAYVPHEPTQKVYELDGLQQGPIEVGSYGNTATTTSEENKEQEAQPWYGPARQAIQERMQAYSTSEIKFNLMAVVGDKRVALQSKLDGMMQEEEESSTAYAQVQADLATEHAKRSQWKHENERRRHNYIPLCVQLLKELAKQGNLPELVSQAQDRIRAKLQKTSTTSAAAATPQ